MAEFDHLNLLALDAARAGEDVDAADAAHLAACATCQAQLAELAGLAEYLKALHGTARPDAAVDARIAWLARGHAARVRRASTHGWHRAVRAPATWAAAALAVLALASAMLLAGRGERAREPFPRVAAAPRAGEPAAVDLDGDGRITVLDAFALARALEHHAGAEGIDVNNDTRIDEDDVDAVLAMAVSVHGT